MYLYQHIKIIIPAIVFLFSAIIAKGQEEREQSVEMEQKQESIAEREEQTSEDNGAMEELQWFVVHPLNMNVAEEDDLKALIVLSPAQIMHFMQYRKLIGRLISIYELQSVPFWDLAIIKMILPYITVENETSFVTNLISRITGGDHSILMLNTIVPEKAKGYQVTDSNASRYEGGRLKLLLKYRYVFKNLLQYGLVAEKDAGEQFFKGKQENGFDFYSFHFFLRRSGIIKALAIGDFSVNLGQGLIHWQSTGLGKSADVLAIKRQAAILRPYTSAGEHNFQRGAGITLAGNNWEGTVFISKRKLDASLQETPEGRQITSVNISGYHRTQNEILNKGNAGLLSSGLNFKYRRGGLESSFNFINYRYSAVVQKTDYPYNYFAPAGRSFSYAGIDYGYTHKNIHLFGEYSMLHLKHRAMVNGLLVSLDKCVDAGVLFRGIQSSYGAPYGNAFTENTLPGNETGFYTSVIIRPFAGLSLSAYSDLFSFPWLRYRVNSPDHGREYLFVCSYKPDKRTEVQIRYRYKSKGINESGEVLQFNPVTQEYRENLRLYSSITLSSTLTLRNRVEVLWLDQRTARHEQGFLLFMDLIYRSMKSSWSGDLRLACFDTESFESGIYAYERDVMNNSTIYDYFHKGSRYFINIRKKIIYKIGGNKKSLNVFVRWSQTINNQHFTSSGLDEIKGRSRSAIKLELIFL